MQKKAVIKVVSVQKTQDGSDQLDFFTSGSYELLPGAIRLCYKESEEIGLEGNTVTLTVEEGVATMERKGKTAAIFVIDTKNKHFCNYETGYGSILFGVNGKTVEFAVRDDGTIYIYLKYTLDANSSFITENKMFIRISDDDAQENL